jgi:hypothetical protein
MFANRTRVLLILPQEIVDRARVLAGKATTALKLPVSLQIVLRALIEEGLRRDDDAALVANVEGQAKAVRQIRSLARRGDERMAPRKSRHAEALPRPGQRARPKRRT